MAQAKAANARNTIAGTIAHASRAPTNAGVGDGRGNHCQPTSVTKQKTPTANPPTVASILPSPSTRRAMVE
jgi:hypothetical protein